MVKKRTEVAFDYIGETHRAGGIDLGEADVGGGRGKEKD